MIFDPYTGESKLYYEVGDNTNIEREAYVINLVFYLL